jgi:hypothetical protein
MVKSLDFSLGKKTLVSLFFLIILGANSYSQDIEPRRWTVLPLGINAVGAGYAYTFGDVRFDPVLDVTDVTIEVNTLIASYIRPFRIGKNFARVDVLIPYTIARWDGYLSGAPASLNQSGFPDPRIRISMSLFGPKASGPKELKEYFANNPVNTFLGVSLAVTLPLGQYFEDKLINLGGNRFIFRPQVGMVHNWGLWSYELTGSVFIYGNNNDFFNGQEFKQDPIFAIQSHLIKRFKNSMWGSLSVGYGLGGESIVNRQPNSDSRGNILWSGAFGFKVLKKHGIKLAYIRLSTHEDVGSDSNSIIVGWSTIF